MWGKDVHVTKFCLANVGPNSGLPRDILASQLRVSQAKRYSGSGHFSGKTMFVLVCKGCCQGASSCMDPSSLEANFVPPQQHCQVPLSNVYSIMCMFH